MLMILLFRQCEASLRGKQARRRRGSRPAEALGMAGSFPWQNAPNERDLMRSQRGLT